MCFIGKIWSPYSISWVGQKVLNLAVLLGTEHEKFSGIFLLIMVAALYSGLLFWFPNLCAIPWSFFYTFLLKVFKGLSSTRLALCVLTCVVLI